MFLITGRICSIQKLLIDFKKWAKQKSGCQKNCIVFNNLVTNKHEYLKSLGGTAEKKVARAVLCKNHELRVLLNPLFGLLFVFIQ